MNDPFLLQRDRVAELFLIRHADAIPEADEIIPSGIYNDLPLSRTGRAQAAALTERLKPLRFDAIFSSPLLRCRQTAEGLAEALGLTPTIVPDIREIRLGNVNPLPEVHEGESLEGLTKALQERQVDIVRIAAETGSWNSIPDSEPSHEFRARVVNAMNEIVRQSTGQRVLVFSHGGAINAYASQALGLQRDFFFPCANTSITVIRANADQQRVIYTLNDVAHLRLP